MTVVEPLSREHTSSISVPKPCNESLDHSQLVLSRWDKLFGLINNECGGKTVLVDGETLDIASVVAVARYRVMVVFGEYVVHGMDQSSEFMKHCLASGHTIYGVNTGFGGSANTHTNKVEKLQRNLIRFLNCGVVANPSANDFDHKDCQERREYSTGCIDFSKFRRVLPNEDLIASTTMPESWVRATLLVRGNSLSRGNSGVRPELVSSLVRLVNTRVTPIIPLRGSISASGDLIPLSYIAATLQGSSEVEVWADDETGDLGRQRVTADVALAQFSLAPIQLGPKEGLAMVNGTAVSAAVGSLALHDAHGLIILSQVLTAMGVEALRGSAESFDPFFSESRPHAGQSEVSSNIRTFLQGSTLLSDKEEDYANGDCLRQDRYSIRTAPQWLGPQLEDIVLADRQMSIEVNSTTDNPLIDWQNEEFLHGGNFQAMAVTSAMEKTRSVLHAIGRLLFAQSSELINPVFSNGLPPNLTADEPSQSFLFKGIDINIASLQAELGFLSTPVPPHVQNAEMGNQSVNSLALISARYTHTALGVLSQMSAAYLLTLCQALDLRALHIHFLAALEPDLKRITFELFEPLLGDVDLLHNAIWLHFRKAFVHTTAVDSSQRFVQVMQTLQPTILHHANLRSKAGAGVLTALNQWTESGASLCLSVFRSTRSTYSNSPDASEFLGSASKRMYKFVRFHLSVPFQTASRCVESINGLDNTSLGALLSKIHCAIQNGALYNPVMDCLREGLKGPKPMMTSDKSLKHKYGSRLILHLIDDIARDDPHRCFCLLSAPTTSTNGFKTVSYSELANAINRVAWWIGKNVQKDLDFETLGYIGPFDLRYTILTIAAQKAGFKAYFPSPRNSLDANLDLLEVAQCKYFLTASVLPQNFQDVFIHRKMQRINMLELDECLDPSVVPFYAYNKSFNQAQYDPFVVLHTSGSTGIPKIVIPSHGTYAASDTYQTMPALGHAPTMVEVLRNKRVFVGLPPFHAAGLFMMVGMTTYFDVVPVLGPLKPLNAEMANDIHVHGNVKVSCIPPSVIEDLLATPTYREKLSTLDCVMYGGGPLSHQAGDCLAQMTSVVCLMGSTETMLLPTEVADRTNWQYFGFSPCMGGEFRHLWDDLYELFIVRNPEFEASQSVFYTFPSLQEYNTKDLYSKHPDQPGLWRYRGRSDDLIVFSTGEKVNPTGMEEVISSHPNVSAALLVGQGRRRSSLLIEAKNNLVSPEERKRFIEDLWPTVERANNLCFAHGRVLRGLILLTTAEKPMLRAGKGTVQRRGTVKLYKSELDALYNI